MCIIEVKFISYFLSDFDQNVQWEEATHYFVWMVCNHVVSYLPATCKYTLIYLEKHYIVPDAIAVNFLMAQGSVEESENLEVCLQVNPGPFMTQRFVSFDVFTVGGMENSGKLLLQV